MGKEPRVAYDGDTCKDENPLPFITLIFIAFSPFLCALLAVVKWMTLEKLRSDDQNVDVRVFTICTPCNKVMKIINHGVLFIDLEG